MRLERINAGGFYAGLVFLVLGFVFLLEELGVWRTDLSLLWPVALVALGAGIALTSIFRGREGSAEVTS
jgi:hypothetical protein